MNLVETHSSDTLFHFTSERQFLENIIREGFAPRYSTEDLSAFSDVFDAEAKNFEFGIPMVCFCDIPLSKAKEHISVYKGYGIGCTKPWGIERGVTPIVYAKPNSETVLGVQNALKSLSTFVANSLNLSTEDAPHLRNIRQNLMRLIKYVKPYEGRFEHGGSVIEDKRFYDEREWRYVPNIQEEQELLIDGPVEWISRDFFRESLNLAKLIIEKDLGGWPQSYPGDTPWIINKIQHSPEMLGEEEALLLETLYKILRNEMNDKLAEINRFRLKVDPLSIKYIIVEKEEDVVPIADVLTQRFRDDYSGATMTRLLTRILTLEQIFKDF